MRARILIVDDDKILCQGIATLLSEEGYAVENRFSGEDAEALIKEQSFDVAVLDYKMSGMSGADLLRIVKEKNRDTKVFIMSGRPFIEKQLKKENVYNLVAGILVKPFTDTVLLKTLEGCLA
jgi:DNA-binding response OmpR family regulator